MVFLKLVLPLDFHVLLLPFLLQTDFFSPFGFQVAERRLLVHVQLFNTPIYLFSLIVVMIE